jgi:hypothetical protein
MKRLTLSIIVVAAAAMAFSSAWGQAADLPTKPAHRDLASKEPTTRKAIAGYWAIIASKVELTDDQKAKLTKLLEDNKTAMVDVRAKLDANSEQQSKAAQSGTAEEKAALTAERKTLLAELRKTGQALHDDFQAMLTPAQQEKFAGYMAYSRSVGQYKPADLSDDQKAKIEALFDQNAKAYLAAKDDDAARKELDKKIDEQVRKDILTKDQVEKLDKYIEDIKKRRETAKETATKAATEPAAAVQPGK